MAVARDMSGLVTVEALELLRWQIFFLLSRLRRCARHRLLLPLLNASHRETILGRMAASAMIRAKRPVVQCTRRLPRLGRTTGRCWLDIQQATNVVDDRRDRAFRYR